MSKTSAFASLGSDLLVRKGTALPAVRATLDQTSNILDESYLIELSKGQPSLGWNDFGAVPTASISAKVHQIHAQKAKSEKTGAKSGNHRAAFTLRLDDERHLRLRLASAIHASSAQKLVTEALDRFLEDIPNLELLTAQASLAAGKA